MGEKMSSRALAQLCSTLLAFLRMLGCMTGSARFHARQHTSCTTEGSSARAADMSALSSLSSAASRVLTILSVYLSASSPSCSTLSSACVQSASTTAARGASLHLRSASHPFFATSARPLSIATRVTSPTSLSAGASGSSPSSGTSASSTPLSASSALGPFPPASSGVMPVLTFCTATCCFSISSAARLSPAAPPRFLSACTISRTISVLHSSSSVASKASFRYFRALSASSQSS
mmetsp:Transcript_15185/g.38127  ORF Transcript_15185/g.38127 Transcript_15185/m.38127 type:complete len:235 (+) Transcript_15185:721-1425(+)